MEKTSINIPEGYIIDAEKFNITENIIPLKKLEKHLI